jgi:uncharacterized membrane protein YhaH (DUF805 family)
MVATAGVLAKAVLAYAPSFRGRATRYELAMTVLLCIGGAVVAAMTGIFGPVEASVIQATLSALLILLPLIAVIVRRLHDVNRSAAALLVLLTPYVGVIILAVILLLDGYKSDNKAGPNPRARRRW